jgi:hypothetical protein
MSWEPSLAESNQIRRRIDTCDRLTLVYEITRDRLSTAASDIEDRYLAWQKGEKTVEPGLFE